MVRVIALSLWLTLVEVLAVEFVGIGIFTFSFFAAHLAFSRRIGRLTPAGRALASDLTLSAYYLGPSWLGSLSGLMLRMDGLRGIAAVLVACVAIAVRLRHQAPATR